MIRQRVLAGARQIGLGSHHVREHSGEVSDAERLRKKAEIRVGEGDACSTAHQDERNVGCRTPNFLVKFQPGSSWQVILRNNRSEDVLREECARFAEGCNGVEIGKLVGDSDTQEQPEQRIRLDDKEFFRASGCRR